MAGMIKAVNEAIETADDGRFAKWVKYIWSDREWGLPQISLGHPLPAKVVPHVLGLERQGDRILERMGEYRDLDRASRDRLRRIAGMKIPEVLRKSG